MWFFLFTATSAIVIMFSLHNGPSLTYLMATHIIKQAKIPSTNIEEAMIAVLEFKSFSSFKSRTGILTW